MLTMAMVHGITKLTEVSESLPNVAITTDMLKPLIDGVTANIGVIIPVGIAIFAILLGISLIPNIISKFTNA